MHREAPMVPELHLVTVYETGSLIEAALLSRRLLDAGIDNQIDGARPETGPDQQRCWQAVRIRVAPELADEAEPIVDEFISEAPG